MNTAVIVICSIVIFLQVILFVTIAWVVKEDKKSKGKDNEEALLEKELWEIDTKIHELQATFKCTQDRLYYLQVEKRRLEDITKEDKEA